MQAPKIVAEVGCNHKGDLEIAKEMIGIAADFANCDVVKFQKRNNRELLTPEAYAAPHPVPTNSYGDSYGEHREALELDLAQHGVLQAECARFNVGYSCSVWDLTSAREIASLNPPYIKVPSACNLHFPMLEALARDYAGDIHISLGMTTRAEADAIVQHLEAHGAADRVVLYACTSGYPVAAKDVCLLEVTRLQKAFGERVKEIGFSGHHLGIAVDMAAVTLGATWIERHFTLDRTWKGTDHAASLEPDGLRRLARDAEAVTQALTSRPPQLLAVEEAQRDKLKFIPAAS